MLTYQTIQELCQAAEAAGSTISQVILAGQAQQLGLEPSWEAWDCQR